MRTRATRRLRHWGLPALPALTLVGLVLASSDAAAAEPSNAGKRFRFHGELDVLSFRHFNPDGDGNDNRNTIGFGFGKTTGIDAQLWVPSWSLGFGYVFLDGRAVAGAKFVFDLESESDEEDEMGDFVDVRTTTVSGQFIPYFRWIFLPGRRARPFVEGRFGLGGSAVNRESDSVVDARQTVNLIYPAVGLSAGGHIWIVDAFSLDLALAFDYTAPHSKFRQEVDGMTVDESDFEKSGDLINLAGQAGFSVWF